MVKKEEPNQWQVKKRETDNAALDDMRFEETKHSSHPHLQSDMKKAR